MLLTSLGVASILLFWGMMEMGVGMIAVCLPTLRPFFRNWSLESIVRSFRSISLRSIESSRKSCADANENVVRSDSETAIIGPQQEGLEYKDRGNMDVEAYPMGRIGRDNAAKEMANLGILRDTQAHQTSNAV